MPYQPTKKQGKERKVNAVATLSEKLNKSKAVFLTEYRGMTNKQFEDLRKTLKKNDAELVVSKNTLLKLAITKWDSKSAEDLKDSFQNPLATLLVYGDEIAPIKELAKFIKSTQLPKVKIGVFNGKVATADDFNTLSTLPSREVLLATLLARLQGPISGLHYALRWNLQKLVTVLDNVKAKKPAN